MIINAAATPELSIIATGQKDRGLWGREWVKTGSTLNNVPLMAIFTSWYDVSHATGFRVWRCNLKGHCHAIWQLNKKLEGVFASTEFQN